MKNVLIVDDEEYIRVLVKELLGGEGYKVEQAADGKEALKILGRKKFDLILLDFFMPSMSGYEVAVKIRENPKTKNAKLAFLTVAEFGAEGMRKIKKVNCLDYIKKPVINKDFIGRVKKMASK